jgi:hypothetical protein
MCSSRSATCGGSLGWGGGSRAPPTDPNQASAPVAGTSPPARSLLATPSVRRPGYTPLAVEHPNGDTLLPGWPRSDLQTANYPVKPNNLLSGHLSRTDGWPDERGKEVRQSGGCRAVTPHRGQPIQLRPVRLEASCTGFIDESTRFGIWCSGVSRPRRTTCCQTAALATAARICDHIATMPCVTGRDRCPNRIDKRAVTSTNGDARG